MDQSADGFEIAGTLEELRAKGQFLLRGRHRPVLVVYDHGFVYALDNRCPHMGFPLDKGTIEDGILTCHWHHARFDVASGCTFDLWADDVPSCPVEVRGNEIWVNPTFGEGDARLHCERRLTDGLSHRIGLVIAKSVQGLLAAGVPPHDIVRQAALFGVRNRDGWSSGLTILTALGNLVPCLGAEEVYVALYHGARRVANDCADEAPRRGRDPLSSAPDLSTLKRWFRHWAAARHREGAERTLLTAIAAEASPADLADLLFAAETDRVFAGGGHSLDFINKAFECLDLIGWEHATKVLPTIVEGTVMARGAAESTAWRQPIDLIALLEDVFTEIPDLFIDGAGGAWDGHESLAHDLLADDPEGVVDSLKGAIRAGAAPVDLGRSLAYAAALRLARFGEANEQSDWETAHHAFTYCNAVHQALKRIGGLPAGGGYVEAVRGVFHGAMAVYLSRYLNVPPAPIPGDEGVGLDGLPSDGEKLLAALLEAFDRPGQVDLSARIVARFLERGNSPDALISTLGRALLREDAGFHAYQLFEAGVKQFREWGDSDPGRHVLIGVTRYLVAHSPTTRSIAQTARTAEKLMRGAQIHEDNPADAS
ncbi:MAG: Rieske (2Fe-2S) protein [Alphaproteobacteria bacterium]|nr:Rieske (2Fe-2S) protein [Alphaproteobacteria bacterium]